MAVRAGYKQTEVGMIPQDWVLRRVDELAATVASGTSAVGSKSGEFLVYGSTGAIGRSARADYSGMAILAARVGANAGALNVVDGEYGVTDNTLIIRMCESVHLPYVFRQLEAKRLNSMVYGSGQPLITGALVKNLLIAFPPSDAEEAAITEALSDTDALIESLGQLIAKKRLIMQGARQALLTGKRHLTGFGGEWETKRLGDHATVKARIGWQGLTTAEYRDSGDHRLVTGTEFKDGFIDWSQCHHVDECRYAQDRHIQLRERDVLVTKDGTIGKVAFVAGLTMPATLNSGVFVVRPIADSFDPRFFYYLLRSSVFTEFLGQLSAGSTINHLYQKDFVGFVFKTPARIDEQIAIATVLSNMDAEVSALESKLAKAHQIKQGMMQELLTGRIRLV